MEWKKQWESQAGAIWQLAASLHRRLRRPRHVVPLPLTVIGSLRAGGGGKTPVLRWLAERLPDTALIVHPTPDELPLLGASFPGRVFPGHSLPEAWSRAQASGFRRGLCDGGFQDPRLAGARQLLLWNEPAPASRDGLLPFGPFRELAPAAARADFLLVREGLTPPIAAPVFFYRWKFSLPSSLPDGPVLLACGVGSPQSVRDGLAACGLAPVAEYVTGDHRSFSRRRIAALTRQFPGAVWIGTAKDLPRWPQDAPPLYILRRSFVPASPEALLQAINEGAA